MLAHIPDDGGRSQLDVLALCIERALDELAAQATWDAQDGSEPLLSRIAALSLLWRTYEVLAGNFERASREVIDLIARLEESRAIGGDEANELMHHFEQALGEMYVHAMAGQLE